MKIVILDTETSGSSQEDKVISLAIAEYKNGELNNMKTGFFNPGVCIKQGAYWVHHISDDQVSKEPFFRETEFYSLLKKIFSSHENVVIGHAICNDLFMLAREGLRCRCNIIDTQYCAVKILKKTKTSLHYLQSDLNLYDESTNDITFHTADGDVKVTYFLLKELLKHLSLKKLIEMSMAPMYDLTLRSNKYKRKKIYQIACFDRGYLQNYFNEIKDPKAFFALMYFYENAGLFSTQKLKHIIMNVLTPTINI
ncbi:MAG: 3'-5' exonuclease [Candidatus Cloacimonetes bacterium]|nr:3'-5' exonuclease [Candidatus Cloacimonadota bacterium]MDD4155624.1 3'-5' exonuclease [Candidatus Cloacimonadota bacterium]